MTTPTKYVYVAGPISNGDTLRNLRDGMLAGIELIKRGFVPMVPHQDFMSYMLDPDTLDYETVLQIDFEWIKRCDALLRLPGESSGADREIEFAEEHGVPVFYSIPELERARDERGE